MKSKKNNKQDCVKSICEDKRTFNITGSLLDTLCQQAKDANQTPCLEVFIKTNDGCYYRLRCEVEKVRL